MGLIIDEAEEFVPGNKIYPKNVVGHVLLVWAVDYIAHSPTAFNDGTDPKKPCDVVVVDVVDLDQVDPDTGAVGLLALGSWWRQGRLIQRLKPRVGKPNPMLGRMSKGVGANAAYELVDLSADLGAVARANAWWNLNSEFTPGSAQTPAAPPAQPQEIYAGSTPPPAPSPLEQAANASLGRLTDGEESALARLRRLGNRSQPDTPPF